MRELFRKKMRNHEGVMTRRLGVFELSMLGIGSIIGAGIFVITGQVAATMTGPAIVISFLLGAVAIGVSALMYAELSTAYPVAGGAYAYTYATAGELLAWLVGWNLLLEYGLIVPAIASGWSGYFRRFIEENFGVSFLQAISGAYNPAAGTYFDLFAFLITAGAFVLIARGVSASAKVNSVIVVLKLLVLGLFVLFAVPYFDVSNLQNFMPFGVEGIWKGAALLIFAYLGFDAVATMAEEVKNPQKTLPKGLIVAMGISTILYIIVGFMLTAIVPFHKLNVPDSLAFAMYEVGEPTVASVIALGAVVTITTVIIAHGMAFTRVCYALSRDGLLFKPFGEVHAKFGTPLKATVASGFVLSLIAALVPLKTLAELINIGTLFAYLMVAVSLVIARKRTVEMAFKMPAMKILLPLNVALIFFMLSGLGVDTWIRFFVWSAVGVAIYFYYGKKNSLLATKAE